MCKTRFLKPNQFQRPCGITLVYIPTLKFIMVLPPWWPESWLMPQLRSYIKSAVDYCERAGNERLVKTLALQQLWVNTTNIQHPTSNIHTTIIAHLYFVACSNMIRIKEWSLQQEIKEILCRLWRKWRRTFRRWGKAWEEGARGLQHVFTNLYLHVNCVQSYSCTLAQPSWPKCSCFRWTPTMLASSVSERQRFRTQRTNLRRRSPRSRSTLLPRTAYNISTIGVRRAHQKCFITFLWNSFSYLAIN